MRNSRFRFSLGQLVALIAACAVVFAVFRFSHWSLLLATGLILCGFAYDRSRGGSGLLGAMLGGIFIFVCALLALNAYLYLTGKGSYFESDRVGALVTFVGLMGLFWGTIVGVLARLYLLAFGPLLGSRAGRTKPAGPILRLGPEDCGLEGPISAGHRP